MEFISRRFLFLLASASVISIVGAIVLTYWKWKVDAQHYEDNILIETVIGGVFVFVPLLVGTILGQKLSENRFHAEIKPVLGRIKDMREKKLITGNDAQQLVMEIARAFGKDALSDPWYQMALLSFSPTTASCGICGQQALIKEKKCANCKLNCFAWEVPAVSVTKPATASEPE